MLETQERILIVEDDALVAEMIQEWVEREGYAVAGVVYDGRDAVDAVERLKPDIVVMDLQMPEMDGVEATRRIQEAHPTPVVVLTAHDDVELAEQAARVGAAAYLVKPSSGRELSRTIAFARSSFVEEMVMRDLIADLTEQVEDLGTFTHMVAHDLLNAVTPVVGIAELLRADLESTPLHGARQQLDMITRTGRRLRRMIDDLLMFAEVRERDLSLTRFEMCAPFNEARERLSPLMHELDGEIIAPESWPVALGYGPWVVEVWVNYLSNALKYGGRPPRIEAGYTEQHAAADPGARAGMEPGIDRGPGAQRTATSSIRFYVRDNGPGLTVDEQAQLFAPFVQLRPTQADGHGLGLSIVHRIVDKLGGDVGVESQVGHGSTFWFTLPAAMD
ncbi:MAG: response regulator [Anaerolineae bacterium]|nr:response regulator [Anaerolineae bacterium]